ncbi:MAG: glycerophosphodiester phosphodiesterase [Rhodothermia bacterium]|nr:glycerophosphodiester phosphodiesterase [Rhodothermia bacterium]
MPRADRIPFDLQGHRGARGLLPENTIPAFRRALELGVATLEMDVVISQDKKVVVSHDPHFHPLISSWPDGRPVTEGESKELLLFRMPYNEIATFDCGLRGHPDFPDQQPMPATKPLLTEVISMAESESARLGRAPLMYNIETKSRKSGDNVLHPPPAEFTRLLYDVLRTARVLGRSVIQSFDVRTLREARSLDRDWRTSLLAGRLSGRFMVLKMRELGFKPDIYSPHRAVVGRRMIRRAHRKGVQIIPWTVNDAVSMMRLAEMGVDGLITDYPDIALRTLERFLR